MSYPKSALLNLLQQKGGLAEDVSNHANGKALMGVIRDKCPTSQFELGKERVYFAVSSTRVREAASTLVILAFQTR
jgi:hypothetical protein